MKITLGKSITAVGFAVCGLLTSSLASASPLSLEGVAVNPMIGAGVENNFGPPDLTPPQDGGAPFVAAGDFTGVVSINTRIGDDSFICTGSAISRRHIITAAHCVDNPDGSLIDLTTGDVRAVFSDGGVFNDILTAATVDIHPGYTGFGLCGPTDGPGFFGGCLNDDIAILTLKGQVPEGTEIYDFYTGDIDAGELFTMVGHGTTGNGIDGFNPGSADFINKRYGFNVVDYFDCDDAGVAPDFTGGWTSSAACPFFYGSEAEVWYADFDGLGIDPFCTAFGTGCDRALSIDTTADVFEAIIGGGDSGGPSFIYDTVSERYLLAGNNTFGANTSPIADGGFGDVFGGNLYAPYISWIQETKALRFNVSAPATAAMLFGGLAFVAMRRRKTK